MHTQLDTKLQHYYEVLAEKLSADIAHTVVWEGAAKNQDVRRTLEMLNGIGHMVRMYEHLSIAVFTLALVIIRGKG